MEIYFLHDRIGLINIHPDCLNNASPCFDIAKSTLRIINLRITFRCIRWIDIYTRMLAERSNRERSDGKVYTNLSTISHGIPFEFCNTNAMGAISQWRLNFNVCPPCKRQGVNIVLSIFLLECSAYFGSIVSVPKLCLCTDSLFAIFVGIFLFVYIDKKCTLYSLANRD